MVIKNPTPWVANPNAQANQRVYDSGTIVYDSASLTYDGNVAGEPTTTTKKPTIWSNDGS